MRIVAAAIPLFLLLQVAPGPTATSLNDLPKTSVPDTYFGLNNAGRTWTHPWPTMETGAIRLFDSISAIGRADRQHVGVSCGGVETHAANGSDEKLVYCG